MPIGLWGKAKGKMTNAVHSNYSLHPKGGPKWYYSQTCSPDPQISSQPQNLTCRTLLAAALPTAASPCFWSTARLESTSFPFKPREKLKNSALKIGFLDGAYTAWLTEHRSKVPVTPGLSTSEMFEWFRESSDPSSSLQGYEG